MWFRPHHEAMAISHRDSYALRAGTALRIGSIVWPRPYYPTLHERARLVAQIIPPWAIASGRTAGWVWTGMGEPEPWSVLRPIQPAPSPLERLEWSARTLSLNQHALVRLENLVLLSGESVAIELLLRDQCVDTVSTQVALLTQSPTHTLREQCHARRMTQRQRVQLDAMLEAVDLLRRRYPDITRYTS